MLRNASERNGYNMANLMGITNPAPSYDTSNNNRALPVVQKPGDTQIQNVIDPSRVNRSDARTDQQSAQNNLTTQQRYDSNLQTFLQTLREAPDLASELSRLVTLLRGSVDTPGLSEGIAKEMATLLQTLKMDEATFKEFFLGQMQANNRFSGPLFEMLRQAFSRMNNDSIREAILNFAKRYSDFSSTEHITKNLSRLLGTLPDYMPQSWKGSLQNMASQLQNLLDMGNRGEALRLLQGDILPYLANYASRTNDMGGSRVLISMLMLEVARYENGGEEGLLLAFRQLGGYGGVLSGLSRMEDNALMQLLRDNAFTRAGANDLFSAQLAQTASQALQGTMGVDIRDAFSEIIKALLINESVFMPLKHAMIPLEWQGKMMYSEFWVDPNAKDGGGGGDEEGQGDKIQFLFKLDIESLGFLEMTLAARGDRVELNVFGPDSVADNGSIIARDLQNILELNGLRSQGIKVQKEENPIAITQVFPDLFDGRSGVNVKI